MIKKETKNIIEKHWNINFNPYFLQVIPIERLKTPIRKIELNSKYYELAKQNLTNY